MNTAICQKCDKNVVAKRNYDNGDKMYIHEQETHGAPFPHNEIIDYCYVSAKEESEPQQDPMEAETAQQEQEQYEARMRNAHGY